MTDRPTNSAPKRVDPSEISTGPRGEQPLVELRFVNPEGETEVWMLGKGALPWEDESFRSAVRLAYLDRGVDTRLATQRESIERLQKHVQAHHDDVNRRLVSPLGNCRYVDEA